MKKNSVLYTLSKALDNSSASAQPAPDLFEAPAILSDTTVRWSAAEEDLKTILEIRNMATFLDEINKPIIYKFFKDFTNKKKINKAVVFSCRPFLNILKGCIHYIFASLFCMSEREHLWNKEKYFLFHFESSFRSWDNQILTFQIFKCHDIIKCLSMKRETHIIELLGK